MFKLQFPEFPLGLRRRAEHGVLAAGLAAGTRGPGRCQPRAPWALAAAGCRHPGPWPLPAAGTQSPGRCWQGEST